MQSGANPEKICGTGGHGPLGSSRGSSQGVLSTRWWECRLDTQSLGDLRHREFVGSHWICPPGNWGPREHSFKGQLLRLLAHPSHRAWEQVKSSGSGDGGPWLRCLLLWGILSLLTLVLSAFYKSAHLQVPSCLCSLLCPILCPLLLPQLWLALHPTTFLFPLTEYAHLP